MPLHVRDATLTEETENGHSVLRGTGSSYKFRMARPVMNCALFANPNLTNPVYYTFSYGYNYYHRSGGVTNGGSTYTAPQDGTYLVQAQVQGYGQNQYNRYWDLRINNSVRVRSYTSTGTHTSLCRRNFPTGMVCNLSEGDTVRCYLQNVTIFNVSYIFCRLYIAYLG